MDAVRWPWCADARTLALFRCGLGLSVACDVVDRARDLDLYVDGGPVDLAELKSILGWSPTLLLSTNPAIVALFMCVAAMAGVALAAGWRTRAATVVCIVTVTSLQSRLPLVYFGGDALLIALLWLSLLMTLHARWSVDSGWDRRPLVVSSPAVLVVVMQAVVLHAGSVFFKLESAEWRGGGAVTPLLLSHIHPSPLGQWVGLHAPPMMAPFAAVSLGVEAAAVLLLVPHRRLRLLVGGMLIAMQLGMALLLEAGLFQLFAIVVILGAMPLPWARADDVETVVETSRLRRTLAIVCVVLLPLTNTLNVFTDVVGNQAPLLGTMGLNQSWRMYSHPKEVAQGYFYVVAVRSDGVLVDLWNGTVAPAGQRPAAPFSTYASFRVRRLWEWLLFPPARPFLGGVARWQCRRAQAQLGDVAEVRAWFVDEGGDPHVATLFEQRCATGLPDR